MAARGLVVGNPESAGSTSQLPRICIQIAFFFLRGNYTARPEGNLRASHLHRSVLGTSRSVLTPVSH